MDRPLVALVLAGGTGTRLYPASRSDRPKQFLAFDGEESLLSRTVSRVSFADRVFVSTRPAFADEVVERVPEAELIVEPAAKDTGPALVYAAHRVRETVGDCVVFALPSDHRVADREREAEAVRSRTEAGGNGDGDGDGDGIGEFETVARTGARVAATDDELVTFGVEPTRPDTGYGYVEPGADRGDHYELDAFYEKPDAETAAEYVEAGYLWNAGMFAWTPAALLSAARDSPLASLIDALEAGDPERGFEAAPDVSVDYAVLERAEDAAVVPAGFAWDDLGSWDALERVLPTDGDGNAALGEALTVDAGGNVIASDGKHVSVVGVDDLCVVAWNDRVLVVPKARAQRVRAVVARLRGEGRF